MPPGETPLNIRGNSYQLLTEIKFRFRRICIRHVLAYAEYDQEKCKTMSTGTAQLDCASLLRRTLPAVIDRERENERCVSVVERLERKGEKVTSAERRLAELLMVLIADFEEKNDAMKPTRPVEILHELMQANGLKHKDLLDIFGTPPIISEVPREKRALTVDHIRKLSRRFPVSPGVFF